MTNNHGFAKALEIARAEKNLTQKQVAELADTSVRQYQNIVNKGADTSLSTAMRIAAVLEVSLDKQISNLQADKLGIYRKSKKSK